MQHTHAILFIALNFINLILKMSNIHVRIKDNTKKAAIKVLDEMGIDMSTAITMYLHQIVITQTIPFRLVTENGLTPQEEQEILMASAEAKRGINVKGPFKTKKPLRAHLTTL